MTEPAKSLMDYPASPIATADGIGCLDEDAEYPCVFCGGNCGGGVKIGQLYRCHVADNFRRDLNAGLTCPCPLCGAQVTKATFRHCDQSTDALLGVECRAVTMMEAVRPE